MWFFAGVCGEWYGDYGTRKEPNVGTHKLFAFLTTEANGLVRPVHAKAMPVVLGSEFEVKHWLSAAPAQIEAIQARVLPEDALRMLTDDEASVFAGFYMK